MPIYVYRCVSCGLFEVQQPLASAGAPTRCPGCGSEARRRFTPPNLALIASPVRQAMHMEEKSAHQPAVVTEKTGRPLPHRHVPSPPWVLGH